MEDVVWPVLTLVVLIAIAATVVLREMRRSRMGWDATPEELARVWGRR